MKKFAKYIISQTSNTNIEIFVKRKIFAKKNSIKKIVTKNKFVEKNFRRKNFSKKKNAKRI